MFRNLTYCCLLGLAVAGCAGCDSRGPTADPTPLVTHAQAVAAELFASKSGVSLGVTVPEGLTLLALEDIPSTNAFNPVVSVRQQMTPWERAEIAAALEVAGLAPEEAPVIASVIAPEEFVNVNAQIAAVGASADDAGLDAARHAYALALPLVAYPVQWKGATFYPAMIFSVPPGNTPDEEDHRIELFRFLLALLAVIPAQDPPVAPPPAPNCQPLVPNTDAAVRDARSRLSPANLHKNHPNPNAKQGQWMHDPQNNRVARGQTLTFYKAQLGVGCDNPNSWGVGLESFDLQFRIVLGPGAANRPAADSGQTPGGLEGTLAHEAEHGETLAEAFRAALDGQNWNGIPWGIKTVLDSMRTTRYKTRRAAERALPTYRRRLETAVERLIRSSANLHAPAGAAPGANTAPRDGTPEPLDNPDQQTVNDAKPRQAWIDEVKDLVNTQGYKSYTSPGQFGAYP